MIKIEILGFSGCPNYDPAVALVKEVVKDLEIDAVIKEVEVRDMEDARRLRFFGSPSIQVNGVDIDPAVRESTDYSYCCRTYEDASGLVPKSLLMSALQSCESKC